MKGKRRRLPPSRRGNRATTEVCRYAPDPEQDRFSAYHEAGHAVAASVLGDSLVSVDIHRRRYGDGYSFGYTNAPIRMRKGDIEQAKRLIIQALAGPMAETMVNLHVEEDEVDADDRQVALLIAAAAIGLEEQEARSEEIRDLVRACVKPTADFLNSHRDAVEAVAGALLARRSLTAEDVARIVAANPPRVVAANPPRVVAAV